MLLVAVAAVVCFTSAFPEFGVRIPGYDTKYYLTPLQILAEPVGIGKLTAPDGAVISYKEPGNEEVYVRQSLELDFTQDM